MASKRKPKNGGGNGAPAVASALTVPQQEKQRPAHLWKPGQSGNPKGRLPGARAVLGEAFLADMVSAWKVYGKSAIMQVAADKPADFLRVVASVLPKDLNVNADPSEAFLNCWKALSTQSTVRLSESILDAIDVAPE